MGDEPAQLWARAVIAAARGGKRGSATNGSVLGPVYRHLAEALGDGACSVPLRIRPIVEVAQVHPPTPDLLARTHELAIEALHGSRKGRGSYFTPSVLARLLLDATLSPIVEARLQRAAAVKTDARGPGCDDTTRRLESALLRLRVFDPTCGPGAFLVLAGQYLTDQLVGIRCAGWTASQGEIQQAATDVARHCLVGMDLDADSIELARLSLWLAAGRPPVDPQALTPGLVVGDSLNGGMGPMPLFDGADMGPFDVVLGNPPFTNAIEGGMAPALKSRLAQTFPELSGTADLAYYFLALGHRLTLPDGAVGLILPRAFLSSRSARRLRRQLMIDRPPALLYVPENQHLFEGANVYIVLLALRRAASCLASQDPDPASARVRPVHVAAENWWTSLAQGEPSEESAAPSASSSPKMFEVFASMTVAMAYDLLPFVSDQPGPGAPRLVTTGLIDPGICHWGQRTCRYLGQRFACPSIHVTTAMPPALRARLAKIERPKVLVAGLSQRIEAFLDHDGRYCGAVSTFTVLHPQDDRTVLARLVELLNGPWATDRLVRELGAHAMGGGRITITKDFLRRLLGALEGTLESSGSGEGTIWSADGPGRCGVGAASRAAR